MLLASTGSYGQAVDPSARDFTVKYLSIEYVYLDGGKLDGLRKGDQLMITRGDSLIAVLEIRYLSNSSASCLIVQSNGQVLPKDVAILSQRGPQEAGTQSAATADTTQTAATAPHIEAPQRAERKTPTRTSGTISLQIYSWADRSENGLDFLQSTMRVNFRARQIGGKAYHLAVRTRGEYDNRSRAYSAASPEEDWTNRIHELSLAYDDESAPFNFQVGRILPQRLSGAGYIDGGLLERRLSAAARVGLFGGLRPRWQYRDDAANLQKYGSYIAFSQGSRTGTLVEQTAAIAGEYHGSTVSRELLYLQGQLSVDSRWSLSHIAEVDINRGWRREREGKTFTVSNLYLNARYRPGRNVSFSASYDNRRNYWTYETRSVADSLFDDQLRSGLRGQVNLRLPGDIALFTNYGYRKRADESAATNSYSVGLTKTGLGLRGSSLNVRYAAFDGPSSHGSNYGARFSQYVGGSNSIELGYTEYRYSALSGSGTRRNRTAEALTYLSLVRHLFLIGSCQFESGDDTRGTGVRAELGYRL